MEKAFQQDSDLQIDNLPNRLTIFRIILVPFVLIFLYLCHPKHDFISPQQQINLGWYSMWVFFVASITDFFDGYIARKRKIVTVFGSFLDPIADKFLIVSSLIMLMYLDRVPVFLVIFLVLREMYMTSLRLLAIGEGISIKVSQMGKGKTMSQMLGIGFLMVYEDFYFIPCNYVGLFFIYVAFALSLISSITYSVGMIKNLKESRKAKKLSKKQQAATSS